jgi:hypothetical protein
MMLFSKNLNEETSSEGVKINEYKTKISDADMLDLKQILQENLKDLRDIDINEKKPVQEVEQVSQEKKLTRISRVIQKTKNIFVKVKKKTFCAKTNIINFIIENKIKVLLVTLVIGTTTILYVIVGNKAIFLSFVSTKIK